MKKITTRRFVTAATIAALYVVLTVGLAPVSFGAIQFRVSEALKAFVLLDPFLAFGIGLGTFIANIFSPYAGAWEFIWMPITDIVGGLIAWVLFKLINERYPAIPMIIYAVTTGLAVGLMLQAFGLGGFWLLSAGVIASEMIILLATLPIMLFINKMLEARGFTLKLIK
jgi:uncharacterized membrane protein